MRINNFRFRLVRLARFILAVGCCLLLACWLGLCGCTVSVIVVRCAWVEVRLDAVELPPCCSFARVLLSLLLLLLSSAWLRRCGLLSVLVKARFFVLGASNLVRRSTLQSERLRQCCYLYLCTNTVSFGFLLVTRRYILPFVAVRGGGGHGKVAAFVYPSFLFLFWLSWSSRSRRVVVLRQVVGLLTAIVRGFACYFPFIVFVLFDIGVLGLQAERASFLDFEKSRCSIKNKHFCLRVYFLYDTLLWCYGSLASQSCLSGLLVFFVPVCVLSSKEFERHFDSLGTVSIGCWPLCSFVAFCGLTVVCFSPSCRATIRAGFSPSSPCSVICLYFCVVFVAFTSR